MSDRIPKTEGMPDMMPQGTVDNPPQKEPQNIPDRMVDQPYGEQPEDFNDLNDEDGLAGDNINDSLSIPMEYESVIEQITEAAFNGYVSFLNPETLEIEQVAGEGVYDIIGDEFPEQNDDMIDEYGLNYTDWDSYIRFEPFGRNDTLNRIDLFIKNMDDEILQSQLEGFSDSEELYQQFPSILERTGHTEDWNFFKRNEIESYVKSQLVDTIRRRTSATEDVYTIME